MKKDLIIIGAGNVGGFIAYNFDHLDPEYNLLGFLDDDPSKYGKTVYGIKVLGAVSDIANYPSVSVILGIAFPKAKQKVVEKISQYGIAVSFVSFIHPLVWVSKAVSLGLGVVVYPGVSINYETKIGDFCTINMNCAVGHNVMMDQFSSLAPNVGLAGFTHLQQGADMGIGSCTKQQVEIGEFAVVGGNSMLLQSIPSGCVAVGSPARVLSIK